MNYEQFRTAWHYALKESGLMPFPPNPSETINIERFSRTYKIAISWDDAQRTPPFYITAAVEWVWDTVLAARSDTTEQHLLMEMLGRDAYDLETELPWLRIGVTLSAGPPLDSPLPMPEAKAWRRWVTEVNTRVGPFLPVTTREDKYGVAILSARSEPMARIQCQSDGRLSLSNVQLEAWQSIDLPRVWDDPERPFDPEPDDQLIDFASRVRQALQSWEHCLPYLQTSLAI